MSLGRAIHPDDIAELLAAPVKVAPRRYPPLEAQVGPLRWFDIGMRCASRGCSSPTYCKVLGIPRCTTHALLELNTIAVEGGVK